MWLSHSPGHHTVAALVPSSVERPLQGVPVDLSGPRLTQPNGRTRKIVLIKHEYSRNGGEYFLVSEL